MSLQHDQTIMKGSGLFVLQVALKLVAHLITGMQIQVVSLRPDNMHTKLVV